MLRSSEDTILQTGAIPSRPKAVAYVLGRTSKKERHRRRDNDPAGNRATVLVRSSYGSAGGSSARFKQQIFTTERFRGEQPDASMFWDGNIAHFMSCTQGVPLQQTQRFWISAGCGNDQHPPTMSYPVNHAFPAHRDTRPDARAAHVWCCHIVSAAWLVGVRPCPLDRNGCGIDPRWLNRPKTYTLRR
jgi:hypothetical protein